MGAVERGDGMFGKEIRESELVSRFGPASRHRCGMK
jgi:hypothetical protein